MTVQNDYTSKVTALVVEQFEGLAEAPASLDPQVQLQEYGFDWLAYTELIMRVEEEFTVVIDDETAEQLLSIQAIVNWLQRQEASKK